MLDYSAHLDLIAHDTMRALGSLRRTESTTAVPGCPDWNAEDLLAHLIEMNDIWSWLVENRPRDFTDGFEVITVADDHAARLEQLDATNHRLIEALRGSGPDGLVCYFGEPSPAAAVARLMAVETVVHSRDAEAAAGTTPTPVPAEIAADCVAQQLAQLDCLDSASWLPGAVRIIASDIDQVWDVLVAPNADDAADAVLRHTTTTTTPTSPIAASITAPAGVLLSWLFARDHELGKVTMDGDPRPLRLLQAALGHEVAPAPADSRRRWWRR